MRNLFSTIIALILAAPAGAQTANGQYRIGGGQGKFTFEWTVNLGAPKQEMGDPVGDYILRRNLARYYKTQEELAQQLKQAVTHSPPDVAFVVGLINPVPKTVPSMWLAVQHDGKAWSFPPVAIAAVQLLGDMHEKGWPALEGLPVLIKIVEADWAGGYRGQAANVLARYGADAAGALPVLERQLAANRNLDLAWDAGTTVRASFNNALTKIRADLEANKKKKE